MKYVEPEMEILEVEQNIFMQESTVVDGGDNKEDWGTEPR